MARPVKKLEYRFCKLCDKDVHYKLYRKVNPLKKGYVKENILVVSMKANRIKTDATVEEIRKVADFYEKLLKNSHNKN